MEKQIRALIFVGLGLAIGLSIGYLVLTRSTAVPAVTTNQSDTPTPTPTVSNHPHPPTIVPGEPVPSTVDTSQTRTNGQEDILLAHQIANQALIQLDLQYDTALLLAAEASRMADTPSTRGSLLFALRHLPELATIIPDSRWVDDLAFSPDGKLLAAAFNAGRIVLYDTATGQPIDRSFSGLVRYSDTGIGPASVAFSPDGKLLVASNPYGRDEADGSQIAIWDVATGQLLATGSEGIYGLAFSPDGRHLATSSPTAVIYWQIVEDTLVELSRLEYETEYYRPAQFAIHPNEQSIAVGIPDQKVIIWNPINNEQEELPIDNYRDSLVFNHDGSLLALGSSDGVILWELAEKRVHHQWLTDIRRAANFSADGSTLLTTAARQESFQLWRIESEQVFSVGQPVRRWGHTAGPRATALHPNGTMVAAGYEESNIILWDTTTMAHMGWQLAFTGGSRELKFIGEGTTLGVYDRDDVLSFWDVATGERISVHQGFEPLEAKHYLFNRDFTIAVIANYGNNNNTVLLGNPRTGEMIGEPIVMDDNIYRLALNSEGSILAVLTIRDGVSRISLLDISTRETLSTLPTTENGQVYGLAFNPEGSILAIATGYWDSSNYIALIILWSTETYEAIMPPIIALTDNLSFSSNGRFLITEHFGRSPLTLWDVETGEEVASLESTIFGWVQSVAFQPDGTLLAVQNMGYVNYGERLWATSLMDGNTYQEIAGGKPFVNHVRPQFSPDGEFLITWYLGAAPPLAGYFVVWDMVLEKWQEAACRKVNRNLTEREWRLYFGDTPYRQTCPDLP